MALMKFKDLAEVGKVGDWAFIGREGYEDDLISPAFIVVRLPDGTEQGDMATLLLNDVPNPKVQDWQWDGNKEAPTLTPSINWVGVWHGYLRNGKLVLA